MSDLLRDLPAVSRMLERADVGAAIETFGRAEVTTALRAAIDHGRTAVLAGGALPSPDDVARAALARLSTSAKPGLRRVVNATGVVLHTGLGRAVLPQVAMDALIAEASGYCLLALDDETNERGRRERFCESILRDLTGCEAATVVNNNAAAVMLALNTLADGREVIVSRGQLVEIGGAFRMPDVMARSGCKMVEVGCTNRTHLRDYAAAITPQTAAIIRVHPSNYRVVGFQGEPTIEELVALAHKHGIPVIDDLGSGSLVKLGVTFDEPLVSDSLAAGADVVTCSADKLIGGPQGGILLGRGAVIAACDDNQLARVLRVGKLDMIALEATLRLFKDVARLHREHPTTRMLTETKASVAARAAVLADSIRTGVEGVLIEIVDADAYAGSGALPIRTIPSAALAITPPARGSASDAARRLRVSDPSLFVRIDNDRLMLDPRTIQPGEEPLVVAALAALFR